MALRLGRVRAARKTNACCSVAFHIRKINSGYENFKLRGAGRMRIIPPANEERGPGSESKPAERTTL